MDKNAVRVLYMVSSLRKCGPTNQLYGIVKYLDKRLFQAKILTLSKESANSMVNDFFSLGVEVVSADMPKLLAHFSGKRFFERTIRGFQPDIIHTSGLRPDFYAEAWKGGYPHCATIRGYAYEDYPAEFGRQKGKIMAGFHLKSLSKVQYPICCSYSVAEKLEKLHGMKTSVIQNGVDMDRYYPPSAGEKPYLKKKLGLPQDKRVYIFSGLLIERKEPIRLIKAFNESGIHKDAVLVVLGDGPLRKICSDIANQGVILKGQVNNVLEYLQAGDIFVSASNSEGLPNAVMEAMSTGIPVLLSDIDPHREILRDDVSAGRLFAAGDIQGLSEEFGKSLMWDTQTMGKSARDIIQRRLNAAVMSENYQKTYLKIVQSRALKEANERKS